MGGAIVYFEVVTTPSAQIGGMCEIQMWAGKKAYDLKEIVVQPNDLQKGITQTVSFEISGQDKILALVQEGKDLDDVVKLEMQCANPTPTPKPTPTPTPKPTPTPTPVPPTPTPTPVPPTPTPTPDPQVIYPPLAERFGIWRSNWVAKYGDPPHKITNGYSSTITINLPMCGVVIGYSGRPGYYGFGNEPFVPLGHQEVALAGGHVLGGSGVNQREYTLEVSPPQLLGQGSVTTEYNDQLRKFLDSCGG